MKTLPQRLAHLMAVRGIKRKKDLAEKAGVSPAAVTYWFSGDTKKMQAEPIRRLARSAQVRFEWLMDGRGPMEDDGTNANDESHDFTMVRRLDVKASAGNGNIVFLESDKSRLAFRRDFLATMGLNEARAVLIYADGRSMEPTIQDGAVVLIDIGDTQVKSGRIYALVLDGEVVIKRLHKDDINKVLTIASDNSDKRAYPDKVIAADKQEDLNIKGRAVWMGARL